MQTPRLRMQRGARPALSGAQLGCPHLHPMVLIGEVTQVRGKVFAFTMQGAPNQGDTAAGNSITNRLGSHLLEPGGR